MATSLLYVDGTKRLEVIDNFVSPGIIQINTGLPGLQGKDGPPGPPGPRGPRGRPAPPSSRVIYTTDTISLVGETNHNLFIPANASLIKLKCTTESSITGAIPAADNEMKLFINTSPYSISFISNSDNSLEGNRFLCSTIKIKQYENIALLYDVSSNGWLLLSTTATHEEIDGGTSSS